ncbi:MAG: CDP-alcohol phosphatidyltransferase family protein [Lentisphaerales bacterium]|jgi:CDP-diacylglycerol--glycerol-3-phosphate 3-phosphatidyltransferase|nr:MAG: CDP-alcohol phosphatidyltransferase family protein [Lentisphaerales bacterium]
MNKRTYSLHVVTFLTVVRIPLVLAFFVSALVNSVRPPGGSWLFAVALVSLILSAATDLVDGWLARKLNVTSQFGAHADPFCDKVFYLAALPLLVFLASRNGHTVHSVVLLFFTLFFLLRDQWISFLRAIGSPHGISPAANWSGKARTLLSFPLVCLIYLVEESGLFAEVPSFIYVLETLGFAINLVSIYVYTIRFWPALRKSAGFDAAPPN